MALLHVNYYSDVLGLSMNMDVILPQQTDNKTVLSWWLTKRQEKKAKNE